MIVRCLGTSFAPLEARPELTALLGVAPGSSAHHDVPLEPGTDYLVAALTFGPSIPWCFVFDRAPGLLTPILAPFELLEVRDSRCSALWRRGVWLDRSDQRHGLLAPPCWADDPDFHGRLFEGEEDAMRQMAEASALLHLEFPLPWIRERAVAVGEGALVTDPAWRDVWEADPAKAMTLNPATGAMFHNPLFREP
jgi:hypothetical protein